MIPLRAYLAAGAVAALLASHGCVYMKGRGDGGASVQAKYAKAADRAIAALKERQARLDDLEAAHAIAAIAQQDDNRSIRNAAQPIIVRPIYRTACVDADGVGLLDRAATNANRPLAGFTPSPAP